MKNTDNKSQQNTNMPILGHLMELRHRIVLSFIVFSIVTTICLIYTKQITFILQEPALGIKFLQLAPGEYLFVSIKIALYSAIIISAPYTFYQIILFILPGLTKQESKYIIPIVIVSTILFFCGLMFSYKILIPITLRFLIQYGSDIVEPIWSFDEYFNFILLVLFSTGISFQLPILQIILGLTKTIKWQQMLKSWKYVTFTSTIVGAIVTPSTDPITQILMTLIILILYLSGIITLKVLDIK
uniref:Sec-independent protein translocase component TatC n=1 Tax=Alsidium seaforthii TaxID=2007182 RepID=A0A1Z1MDC7_9FLOR|nr:Sec-independent protein translocase component TatC [Bryothamnion seaforthii]ARW63953.1 Sec-independent protein translocase component TatC [Bryothamnion seaforthii]